MRNSFVFDDIYQFVTVLVRHRCSYFNLFMMVVYAIYGNGKLLSKYDCRRLLKTSSDLPKKKKVILTFLLNRYTYTVFKLFEHLRGGAETNLVVEEIHNKGKGDENAVFTFLDSFV